MKKVVLVCASLLLIAASTGCGQSSVTEYSVPTSLSFQQGKNAGDDGKVWVTDSNGNKHTMPTSGSIPQGITAGPDKNIWFAETHGDKIGKITPSGKFTEYPVPTGSSPYGITAGPDGNIWFT